MGTMAKGLVMLILILCIVILLKAFVLEVYKVAGESMEDTLFDDDRIVVSKLNYGPLLPYMISNDNGRLQGIDEIERNDVVLFTLKSERAPILKRIVGVPGDTITIRDSQLFVGHQQVSDPALSKRMYRVWPNNIDSLYKRLVSEKSESYYDNGKNAWFALLNLEQAGNFETSSFIDSLRITSRFLSSSSKKIFHIETELQWDVDNIGPLLVPKKGLTIPLNENNYIIYHKTILLEEGSDLQYTNGEFTIDGEIATRYTFKYDYYYVLGDHFDRSLDSRQYGFIKREHVIGKAVLLLFRSGNTFYDGTFCKTLE
jgi:signal peptidase I